MIQTKIAVTGLDDLHAQLTQLKKPTVIKSIIRKAMRAAAKITQEYARKAAPVASGFMKSQIKVRAVKRTRKYVGMLVMLGDGMFKGKAFYGAFVEFGHRLGKRRIGTTTTVDRIKVTTKSGTTYTKQVRRTTKENENRRLIEGKEFLKRSSKASEKEAIAVHDNVLSQELDKVFKGQRISDLPAGD